MHKTLPTLLFRLRSEHTARREARAFVLVCRRCHVCLPVRRIFRFHSAMRLKTTTHVHAHGAFLPRERPKEDGKNELQERPLFVVSEGLEGRQPTSVEERPHHIHLVSVLIVQGLSYGAGNVLSYN